MKKRRLIILITILLIILATALVILLNGIMTERKTKINNEYTYTKAICNETNFCQDYIITCNNNIETQRTPITGAVVQFSNEWDDPRDKKKINEFCNIGN